MHLHTIAIEIAKSVRSYNMISYIENIPLMLSDKLSAMWNEKVDVKVGRIQIIATLGLITMSALCYGLLYGIQCYSPNCCPAIINFAKVCPLLGIITISIAIVGWTIVALSLYIPRTKEGDMRCFRKEDMRCCGQI